MASSKQSYDPLASFEGMFKGSLKRLGYLLKDTTREGEATLAILRETTKHYDDALDDCLIEILDAKALLESELAANRARRVEQTGAGKSQISQRQTDVDETVDLAGDVGRDNGVARDGDQSADLIGLQHITQQAVPAAQKATLGSNGLPDSVKEAGSGSGTSPKEDADKTANGNRESVAPQSEERAKENAQTEEISPQDPNASENLLASNEQPPRDRDAAEDPSYQGDLSMESMFAESGLPGDQNEISDNNADLKLDLTDFGPDDLNDQSLASLDFQTDQHSGGLELLPGLASYANADSGHTGGSGSGEDYLNLSNMPSLPTNTATTATTEPTQTVALEAKDGLGLPLAENVPADSSFNDLFVDGDFTADASLMDLDLEDGFFNT